MSALAVLPWMPAVPGRPTVTPRLKYNARRAL
jgi:hypothetical protein